MFNYRAKIGTFFARSKEKRELLNNSLGNFFGSLLCLHSCNQSPESCHNFKEVMFRGQVKGIQYLDPNG